MRYDGLCIIVIGLPAAGKSTFSEHLARAFSCAIVDADDAKKVIPEYQGGVGYLAVHAESAYLASQVLANLVAERANIILPMIGADAVQVEKLVLELNARDYRVELQYVYTPWDEAFRRNALHYLKTGRLVPPHFFDEIGLRPRDTFDSTTAHLPRMKICRL